MNYTRTTLSALLFVAFALLQEQPALSQTRLGLFVTQEELNVWKQRAQSGPYKSSGDVSQNSPGDWNRIKVNADAFLANPSAQRWAGNTLGRCPTHSDRSFQPANTLGRQIRDAAFAYLITGDTNYKTAVRNELMAQAATAGVKWDGPLWSGGNCASNLNGTHLPVLSIHVWMGKMVLAYDFIRHELSSTDKAALDQWFRAFSTRFYDNNYKYTIEKRWPKRSQDDYSSSPYSTAPAYKLYFGGPDWSWWHNGWNNTMTTGVMTHGLIGIMLGDSYLKSQASRFVKEFIKYNIWSTGHLGDIHRWNDGTTPCKGFWYPGAQMADTLLLAEAFARIGDTSLYTYATSDGYAGTSGGNKSLKLMIQTLQGTVNHTVNRFGTLDANKAKDNRYRIDGDCNDFKSTGEPGAIDWDGIDDTWAVIANRYYKDDAIKNGYMRNTVAGYPAYPSAPNSPGGCPTPWEGSSCRMPALLFMFGQMEDKPLPYPSGNPSSSSLPLNPTNLIVK